MIPKFRRQMMECGNASYEVAPYNGAPFLRPAALAALPSHHQDEANPNLQVLQRSPKQLRARKYTAGVPITVQECSKSVWISNNAKR